MTQLQVRRVTFDFEDDVPFCWHPTHPEFALLSNAISLMIIGFEKFVVDAMRAAMPRITDPARRGGSRRVPPPGGAALAGAP